MALEAVKPWLNETTEFYFNCYQRLRNMTTDTSIHERILRKIDGDRGVNSSNKVYLVLHQGLGDILTCTGMIRFLACVHDEVKIVVQEKYSQNAQDFFRDDPTITFHLVRTLNDIWTDIYLNNDIPEADGYSILRVGVSKTNPYDLVDIPFCFYDDLGIPFSAFWDFFYVPSSPQGEQLWSKTEGHPYMFVHNGASGSDAVFTLEDVERELGISRNDIRIINPNANMYEPSHPWYSYAQQFVGHPFLWYKQLIERCSKCVFSDSSFFCLAVNLNIRTKDCFYWARERKSYGYFYEPPYAFDAQFHDSKQKFRPLVPPQTNSNLKLWIHVPNETA